MMAKTIYHNNTNKLPVGYCHLYAHQGILTTRLLKKHKCLSKNCPYIEKNQEHPYWEQRQRIKQKAKQNKKELAQMLNQKGVNTNEYKR